MPLLPRYNHIAMHRGHGIVDACLAALTGKMPLCQTDLVSMHVCLDLFIS